MLFRGGTPYGLLTIACLAVRELDEALGLIELAGFALVDTRRGRNVPHDQIGLFMQALFSRLASYEATNDAAC